MLLMKTESTISILQMLINLFKGKELNNEDKCELFKALKPNNP